MLLNHVVTENLLALIEQGNIKEGISLVNKNDMNHFNVIWRWFHTQFKKTEHPDYWIDFLKNLLLLNNVNVQTKEFLMEQVVSEAIRNQSPKLLLALPPFSEPSEVSDITKMCDLITEDSQISSNYFLIHLLGQLKSPLIRSTIYKHLVKTAYFQYNGFLLQEFQKLDNQEEFNFNQAIPELNLTEKGNKLLTVLLSFEENRAFYINEKMKAFGFGKIDYQAGLLAIAERKQRKKALVYNPTLLNLYENDEDLVPFEKYLKKLKDAALPLTERFIFAASHWICGEININEEGIVKVFFIDSLGDDYSLTLKAIKKFTSVFPESQIFLGHETRLKGMIGCSVYALDDMAHLFRLPLEEKYNTLWDYLSDLPHRVKQKILLAEEGEIRVNICSLPLSLMRTMRSARLFNEVIPTRTMDEQELPVNKKQETVRVSALKFFKPNEEGKLQNNRLEYKLEKLKKHIFSFLMKNTPEAIEGLMYEAELNEFKGNLAHHQP